jgi:uncharacterized protein YidB (DUF937 family)
MSLLQDLLGKVVSRIATSKQAQSVMGELLKKVTLSALSERFTKAGLEKVFASWLSQGNNLPLNKDDVRKLVGEEHIQALASEHNVSDEEIEKMIADHLPDLVDQLSPDGTLPQGH